MSKILVIFSTHDGQTEGIAERIGFRLSKAGHEVTVLAAESPDASSAIDAADGVIIGGAIRFGQFARSLVSLVRRNAPVLIGRPTAFYSVSMSALRDVADAYACMAQFQAITGWVSDDQAVFGGALRFTRFSPFKRFMMKIVARASGEEPDTSRDYEYTDWRAVDRFAAAFGMRVAAPAAA